MREEGREEGRGRGGDTATGGEGQVLTNCLHNHGVHFVGAELELVAREAVWEEQVVTILWTM